MKNEKIYWSFDKIDLINNYSYFINNLNLFASVCYMISYNIVKLIKKKENNAKTLVDNYCEKYRKSINENLIMDNDYEEINDIAEYESLIWE